jgi:hypothetical protein
MNMAVLFPVTLFAMHLNLNVAIFWDVTLCSPYVNQRFVGTYHPYIQGRKSAEQETSAQNQLSRLLHSGSFLG